MTSDVYKVPSAGNTQGQPPASHFPSTPGNPPSTTNSFPPAPQFKLNPGAGEDVETLCKLTW